MMNSPVKIAIYEPDQKVPQRFFTCRVKVSVGCERVAYQKPEKILVVSGIAGNFHALRNLLYRFSVIDNKNRWIFENGHLVIAGNCLDDMCLMTEGLWFIYGLEERAIKKGGHIHLLLGKNELMIQDENWYNRHPNYADRLRSTGRSYAVLFDGSNELLRWLRTKNVMEKIGNDLFLANDIEIPNLESIEEINSGNFNLIVDNGDDPDEDRIFSLRNRLDADTIVLGSSNPGDKWVFNNKSIIQVNANHTGDRSEALLILNDHYYHLSTNGERLRLK